MFSPKFRLYLVALFIICLFGVGLFVYHNHVEFQAFMDDHFRQMAHSNTEMPPNSPDNLDSGTNGEPDWPTFGKRQWETYWSNQEPVKVSDRKPLTADDPNVTTVLDAPVISIDDADLVPQVVETPDGQVHKILWYSKLRPGDPMPPPEDLPMDKVIVDGVMYNVPLGETGESYIDKITLSRLYDVPLESVGNLIEDGVIPNSPLDAQHDPLFDDPLFVKREDSRPVESGFPPSDFGLSDNSEPINLNQISANYPNLDEIFSHLANNPKDDHPDWGDLLDALIEDPNGDHPALDKLASQLTEYPSGDSGKTEEISNGEIDIVFDSASEQSLVVNESDRSLVDLIEKSQPETEAELTEGISSEGFDKTQAWINRYNTEERLHRLQKLWKHDSEATEQFEPEHRPVPSRDVPDGGQSESGSKD